MTNRAALLFAFTFAVMADPVSSVAYAIEAALRALRGDLALLLPTMTLVVVIIVVVIVNYHQLVGRYPRGGGAPAAAAEAFGEASAFIPIAALIVDFGLTIAISTAAAASAIIAFFPALAGLRAPIALLLIAGVAAGTWFGHRGRTVFAVMTVAFVVLTVVVLICGLFLTPRSGSPANTDPGHAPPFAVALAFPVAMALATGIEAPSSAIAQLGELDDPGRRRFGRITLWLTAAHGRHPHPGLDRRAGTSAHRRPAQRLNPDRRTRPRRHRPAAVRRLSARHRATTAVGGQLLLPSRPRPLESACAATRNRRNQHRDPAGVAGPH